jgi:predicted metal-dependent hydrolase
MSHVVAVLSAMFPNGEDFFVRSVRHYRDQLDDPDLREHVNQFIGQESNHRRAHRELNDRLANLGYKTRVVDWSVGFGFTQVSARVLPPQARLAVTAALEHYTATLAEVLLEDTDAQSSIGDDQVRRLLLWHALEESEHKAVSYIPGGCSDPCEPCGSGCCDFGPSAATASPPSLET